MLRKILLQIFSVIILSGMLSGSVFATGIIEENTQDANDAPHREAEISFFYTPGSIYKIYCQPGYLTDIKLQAGEEIAFIGGGDTVRWIIDTAKSGDGKNQITHLYIKPAQTGIDTNLIVNTNVHSYHMQIIAGDAYNPIVSWYYPHEEKIAAVLQKAKEDDLYVAHISPASLNFNYKIDKKKYGWAPVMVFDDGEKTYIKMPETLKTAEAPVLFIKEKKSVALVNYRVTSTYYIVDRLFDEAEMRSGDKEVVKIKKTR